jgi:Outer membrane protein Omp28
MWCDGNQHGGMDYNQWETMIVARYNQPSPVTIDIDGQYSASGDTGTIYAKIRNDSTESITGRVIVVITEDSLMYAAPNGVMIHCNVPRDYLPDDSGEVVTVASGDSALVTRSITTNASWVDNQLHILVWIQNDSMQADSTKEIWQGSVTKLVELGIADHGSQTVDPRPLVHSQPNPCVWGTDFIFNLGLDQPYSIRIFDITGREINVLSGVGAGQTRQVSWNMKDQDGRSVVSGVYLYRFEAGGRAAFGKIVVR